MSVFQTSRFVRRLAVVVLAGGALSLAAGCGEEDIPSGVTPTQPNGRLRVVHAVSDPVRADRINITVATTPLAVNIAYAAVAPAPGVQPNPATYYPIYEGMWPIAVRRTADTTVKVLDATINVAANADYTVLALGNSAGVTALVLTDDNTPAIALGNIRLRVVHASSSAPAAVDVYVTAVSTNIATIAPTAPNVAFRTASPYLTFGAGVHRVRVTAVGSKTPILDTTLPNLAAGAGRTVVVLDRAAGGVPLVAAVLTDR